MAAISEDTPLRAARRRGGLVAQEVADAVGVTMSHYASIERMDARASPELAEKLSHYFLREITEEHILFPERFMGKAEKKRRIK